ncbi:hypothetical protein GCM10029963_22110 [Micromonospora andamanensis]
MFGTLTARVGVAARGALLVASYLTLLAAAAFGWVGLFVVAALAAVLGSTRSSGGHRRL